MEKYNIHTQVNLVADKLNRTARLLDKGKQVSLTKAELKDIINEACTTVQENSDVLMKPRSNLNPIVAGNPNNSLFDELQKIIDDIGTVQYMIAHDDIAGADRLLADIKNRI